VPDEPAPVSGRGVRSEYETAAMSTCVSVSRIVERSLASHRGLASIVVRGARNVMIIHRDVPITTLAWRGAWG